MAPERTWTRAEVREAVGRLISESLAVDAAEVTDDASLVRDLGAESIDFLDIAFSCQQTFGVDLSARVLQDRVLEWRNLEMLARAVQARYGLTVDAETLRAVSPATPAAVLAHLASAHGLAVADGEAVALAHDLATRVLDELAGIGLQVADVAVDGLADDLVADLHSPAVVELMTERFTVAALVSHLATRLNDTGRLKSDGGPPIGGGSV